MLIMACGRDRRRWDRFTEETVIESVETRKAWVEWYLHAALNAVERGYHCQNFTTKDESFQQMAAFASWNAFAVVAFASFLGCRCQSTVWPMQF